MSGSEALVSPVQLPQRPVPRQWVLLGETCCGGRESAPTPFEGGPLSATGHALVAVLILVL